MITANSIRVGNIIEHNKKLYVVMKTMHTQPGKGGAYIQVEMKDIKTGTKVNERFSSSEKINRVRLDQKDFQFLFISDDKIVLMDNETYEQLELNSEMLEDRVVFLRDGMTVTVEMYEDEAIAISLPETVICEIAEAEPVIKGATVTSSYKTAKLDNGLRILVPPFIEAGEKVVVRTEDVSYVERAK